MRKEPFSVGDYVHIIKRGAKKSPIVKDESDRWRFLKVLCHLNDEFISERWEEEIEENVKTGRTIFDRPDSWPDKKPLVSIQAFILMSNHFHILVKEISDGGVSKFMQKVGNSMTGHFNLKYKESGSIFQGSYKARRVDTDVYLRYLCVYIMIKNSFELFEGGIPEAMKDFEKAFDWAVAYPFSSLRSYVGEWQSSIVDKGIIKEIFDEPKTLREFARDCMIGRMQYDEDLEV